MATKVARASVTDPGTGITVTVGDIWRCSWGYDQTNVDFYQVVGITPSGMLRFRPIAQRLIEAKGPSFDVVAARKGSFIGEDSFTRKPTYHADFGGGVFVAIESYSIASPWNGEPTYQTAQGWGH